MRKVIALDFITLDGVIQAGGRPEEDPSGGFAYGGWVAPYGDDVAGAVMDKQMNLPFDLLLGRKTFDIWAPFWSHHADVWPGVMSATKYVASNTMTSSDWQPCVFLSGDLAEHVRTLKHQPGPDLHVYGSAHGLRNEMHIPHEAALHQTSEPSQWLRSSGVSMKAPARMYPEGNCWRSSLRYCRLLAAIPLRTP